MPDTRSGHDKPPTIPKRSRSSNVSDDLSTAKPSSSLAAKVPPGGRKSHKQSSFMPFTPNLSSTYVYEQPVDQLELASMYVRQSRLPPARTGPSDSDKSTLNSLKAILSEDDYTQLCNAGIFGKPEESTPSSKLSDDDSSEINTDRETSGSQRSKSALEQLDELRSAVENAFPTIFKNAPSQAVYNDLVKSSSDPELAVGRMLPMHILDFENYLSAQELREFHSELYYLLADGSQLSIFNFYDIMSRCFKNQLAHRALLSSDMRNKGMLTQFLTCYHKANEAQLYIQIRLGFAMIESLTAGTDLMVWLSDNRKSEERRPESANE